VYAQDIVAPTPTTQAVPPALQQMEASGARTIPPLEAPENLTPLWQSGTTAISPHLLYRFLYGDGIPSGPGNQQKTAINEISAGILLNLGDRWTADYTPTWTFYSNRAFQDTVNHLFQLNGGASYEAWNFGLTDSFARTNSPLIETGRQTKQETSATGLNALYTVTSAVALELTASQNLRYVWGAPDSYEWSTMDWLHYQFAPQLDTAAGMGYGYVEMTSSPSMAYETYEGRVNWRATDKIALNVTGGAEIRQFRNSGQGTLTSPIFNASIDYSPTDTTQLSFGTSRTINSAYFTSQIVKTTSWFASLSQRLLEHFFLITTFTQGQSTYEATSSGVAAGREDRTYAVNVRLQTRLFHRGTAAIFYQRTHNTSNDSAFAIASNQVGFQLGYKF
jgi:hypothetical protein